MSLNYIQKARQVLMTGFIYIGIFKKSWAGGILRTNIRIWQAISNN